MNFDLSIIWIRMFFIVEVDKTLAQMIAHQLEWMNLILP